MTSTTLHRDGPPSPARTIKSPEEVVQATLEEFIALEQQGLSLAKMRREMADALKPTGKLGHLDDESRELAVAATDLLLLEFQLTTISHNARKRSYTDAKRSGSEFNKAFGTKNPSRSRQHLDAAGQYMDLSKTAAAIDDLASSVADKIYDLTSPWSPRPVSFPLPQRYKAALADTPSPRSFRVAIAYAKGQLALMRALEPDLMRSLTARRDRASKPARISGPSCRKQPEPVQIPSSPAISASPDVRTIRPDAIPDLATPATEPEPQPDPGDSQLGIAHSVGETNRNCPGGLEARPVAIVDPGPAADCDGDGPSAPPPVIDGR